MADPSQQQIRIPILLIVLDGIGAILLGIGLYGLFIKEDILFSNLLGFDLKNWANDLIGIGIVMMIPMVIHTIKLVRSLTKNN